MDTLSTAARSKSFSRVEYCIYCSACSLMSSVRIAVLKRMWDCVSVTDDVVFSVYIRQFNLSILGPLYFIQSNPISFRK